MKHAGKEPFPVIYVDSKAEGNVCDKYYFFFLHNSFNTLVINYDMHIMIENNILTRFNLFYRNLNLLLKLN